VGESPQLALSEVPAVSGLLLSGTGNGTQQFSSFSVLDERDFPYTGPKPSANRMGDYAWYQYGLLSYFSVQVAAADWSKGVPGYLFAAPIPITPNPPPAMPSNLQATSSPNRLGQQIVLTDASNFVLEQFVVMLRSETPMGAQKLQWIGTAFHGGTYGIPFTLTATGFNPSDAWTWSIPARVHSEQITDNHYQ
jgi:hypothetical protein